jgi:hypothetical protein
MFAVTKALVRLGPFFFSAKLSQSFFMDIAFGGPCETSQETHPRRGRHRISTHLRRRRFGRFQGDGVVSAVLHRKHFGVHVLEELLFDVVSAQEENLSVASEFRS